MSLFIIHCIFICIFHFYFLPVNITLSNAGKRYNREWIFRNFTFTFLQGRSYAITGANGSGKSTLLQIIAGAVMHSEGKIDYINEASGKAISSETEYSQISFAAPYLDLIEEMTANEFLDFHSGFKPFTLTFPEILSAVGLTEAANKQIRYFSSGMKQRLKLAQSFFSNTSVLLLDEPATNLDEEGISLYKKLLKEHSAGRLVIISSNDKEEYENCSEVIAIGNYK